MYIYVLTDPRTNEVRYVGKAIDPKQRLYIHIKHAREGKYERYKDRWIRSLLSDDVAPEIHPIFPTSKENWQEEERMAIAFYLSMGARLTNATPGGEGVDIPHTPEWVEKSAAAHRGRKATPEEIEKKKAWLHERFEKSCGKGHAWTPENTYIKSGGGRTCRACANQRTKDRRRKNGEIKGTRRKTHCKHGHPLTKENIVVAMRGAIEIHSCRTCRREGDSRRKREKRGST